MSKPNQRRFIQPEFLRQIAPGTLLQWLAPARDYLQTKKFDLQKPDYDLLAQIFAEPDSTMPEYLLESVYLIREMADEGGTMDILGQEERFGLNLKVGDEASPADIAVHAWLTNPHMLRTLLHERELRCRRSFSHFVTDQRRLTPFTQPTELQLHALQERLDAYYKALKRGKGCKVFVYPSEAEILFFVRHGRPFKRAAALKDGEPTSVFYRPQHHDIVIYNIEQDELRMNCCSPHELKVFKRIFGSCLFGDANYFPGEAKYTLDPLVRDGRNSLTCVDVQGMEKVTLKEVEITHDLGPKHRETHKADDIFHLVEEKKVFWPIKGWVSKATFEIRFTGSGKSRKVTLLPSNKLILTRDSDAPIVHDWLHRRSFTPEK